MPSVDLANLIRDGAAAAHGGGLDSRARLLRSAVSLLAPQYAPHLRAVESVATRLGVRLTSEGLDVTGLQQLLTTGRIGAGVDGSAGRSGVAGFVDRLTRLPSGVVLILGPRGKGKTTLAVKLAENWRRQHGYGVLGVNLYRSDSRPWITFKSINVFTQGVEQLVEAMEQGEDPPAEICRRVVLIDEAVLALHPRGKQTPILAVERIIWEARHLGWLLVIVAHLTKHLPTSMEAVDVTCVKEPTYDEDGTPQELRADRDDASPLWTAAAEAYRRQRADGLRGHPAAAWVYVEGLGYRGMVHSGIAGVEDPWQPDQVQELKSGEVVE